MGPKSSVQTIVMAILHPCAFCKIPKCRSYAFSQTTQLEEEKNFGNRKIQKMYNLDGSSDFDGRTDFERTDFEGTKCGGSCHHDTELSILTHEMSKLNDKFEDLQSSIIFQADKIENLEKQLKFRNEDVFIDDIDDTEGICAPLRIITKI